MAEANLRWRASTSEAEAQILALKAVIDSISSTSTRSGIRKTGSDLERVGKDGESAMSRIRSGLARLKHDMAAFTAVVLKGLIGSFVVLGAVLQASILPGIIGLGVALAAIAALAAPLVVAMGAVAALGALGNVFKIGKNGPELLGQWKKLGSDIFDTIHKIAQVVTKPLFAYLLKELNALDKWVHTAEFRKGMEEIGRMLPKVAKAIIGAAKSVVEWYIANWPTIKKVILDTVTAFVAVAHGVEWLAKQFEHYWPIIKHAAEVSYNWFMKNLYPGLRRAFLGVKQIVDNLAAGFKRAWPDISKALQAAWSIIHPILDAIAEVMGKIQDALNWLAKHSGGAFSALAKAVEAIAAVVGPILSGIGYAIDKIVSGLQWLSNHAPGPNTITGFLTGGGGTAVPGGRPGAAHHAAGGYLSGGIAIVGEREPEVISGGGRGGGYVTAPRGGSGRGLIPMVVLVDPRATARVAALGTSRR